VSLSERDQTPDSENEASRDENKSMNTDGISSFSKIKFEKFDQPQAFTAEGIKVSNDL